MKLAAWTFVWFGLAGQAAAGPQQSPATFSVSVETVYVDVFVTERGRTVSGLNAGNFELRDNGVRQRVSVVAHESMPLLAVLAFDVSGSVLGAKMDALRAGARAFMSGLRPSDRTVLLSFNEEVCRPADVREPRPPRAVLEDLKARGTTSLYDALFVALRVPERTERAVLVLFTDGEDNSSWFDDRLVKRVAEESNVLVHVVGIVPAPSEEPSPRVGPAGRIDYLRLAAAEPGPMDRLRQIADERRLETEEPEYVDRLRQIAEATGGRFWKADAPARLEQAFLAVLEAMKTRYILRYEPTADPKPGFHKLEIRLRGAKGDVHARRGYVVAARH